MLSKSTREGTPFQEKEQEIQRNCSGILFYAVFGRTEVLPQFVKVR